MIESRQVQTLKKENQKLIDSKYSSSRMFEKVDKAMFRAKKQSKNQLVIE